MADILLEDEGSAAMTHHRHIVVLAALAVGLTQVVGCKSEPKQEYNFGFKHSTDPAIDNPPPISAQTHIAAGVLAEQGKMPDQAESSYRQAVALEPNNQAAIFSLARVLNSQKKFDESIPLWERLVVLSKGSADSYSNLGFTYDQAKRDQDAELAFRRAISIDPSHRRSRLNYSQLLARQGRMGDAANQMSAVLPPAAVHFNLGLLYERAGKTDTARKHYVRSLQFDPQFRKSADRLAYMNSNPQRPRPLDDRSDVNPTSADIR
jgi:Tfp pilus assembly protein PilF